MKKIELKTSKNFRCKSAPKTIEEEKEFLRKTGEKRKTKFECNFAIIYYAKIQLA